MSGGGETEQSTVPWQGSRDYIQQIMSEAQGLYQDPRTQFQGQMVAGRSDLTAQGLEGIGGLGGQGYGQDAQDFLGQTLRGEFMGGQGQNPQLDSMYEMMSRRIGQQYNRTVQPGITSRFAGSGRLGSPAEMHARGVAQEGLGQALGDTATQLYYGDYQNRMQDRMTALGMAPGIAGMQRADLGLQLQGGAVDEDYQQRLINEQMGRHEFGQTERYASLGQYAQTIGGIAGQYGTTTGTAPGGPGGAQLGLGVGMGVLGIIASLYTGGAAAPVVAGPLAAGAGFVTG